MITLNQRIMFAVALVAALGVGPVAFGADGDTPASAGSTTRPAPQDGTGPRRGGGASGPGMFGGGMFGGGMFGRDRLAEAVTVLGELNLSPDFTLTAEQKQKLQGIRDAFTAKRDQWRSEHQAEFDKLRDEMMAMRGGGGGGGQGQREQWGQIMQASQELMATAPSGEDEVAQVKALLTDDQAKQFQARLEEAQQQSPWMRGGRGGGSGGRFRGGDPTPGVAPDGTPDNL